MSRVSWSATISRFLDVVVGISMLAVYVSLSHAWFSARWTGSYEFYAGNEDAFGARGYPVQIAIRLIVVTCLATVALLLLSAALRVFGVEVGWMTARLVRRVLFGLAACNLALVVVALLLPPRGMVVFPPLALCQGAYVGLLAGAVGAFGAGCALLIPKAVPDSSRA